MRVIRNRAKSYCLLDFGFEFVRHDIREMGEMAGNQSPRTSSLPWATYGRPKSERIQWKSCDPAACPGCIPGSGSTSVTYTVGWSPSEI